MVITAEEMNQYMRDEILKASRDNVRKHLPVGTDEKHVEAISDILLQNMTLVLTPNAPHE